MKTTSLSPDATKADVLIVYEDVDEALFNEAKDWVSEKKERYLVVLKSNLSFVDLENLSHSQVRYYRLPPDQEAMVLKKIIWDFVFLKIAFVPSENSKPIFDKIAFYQTAIHLLASEHADLGKRLIGNFFSNEKHIESSQVIHSLKNTFSNVPAIICGAGASLEERAEEIRLLTGGAVVFAGGSTLKVCSDLGIHPHFAVHFDPDPPRERFKEQSLFEIPFIWQSRLSTKLLDLVHASKWITPGSDGYALDERLFSGETFDAGWVVSNYAVQIANYLGCDPIILIGVDLCTSENRLYAKGVEQSFEGLVPCVNQNGESRFTKPDWLLAASWFEDFARQNPEKKLYNVSSGLAIKGFSKKSISEISFSSEDIAGKVHTFSQTKTMSINAGSFTSKLGNSLLTCQELCQKLLQALEKAFVERSLQKGDIILLESDLEEELAYQTIILPIWQVWKHVFARDMQGQHEFDVFVHKIVFFLRIIEIQTKEKES